MGQRLSRTNNEQRLRSSSHSQPNGVQQEHAMGAQIKEQRATRQASRRSAGQSNVTRSRTSSIHTVQRTKSVTVGRKPWRQFRRWSKASVFHKNTPAIHGDIVQSDAFPTEHDRQATTNTPSDDPIQPKVEPSTDASIDDASPIVDSEASPQGPSTSHPLPEESRFQALDGGLNRSGALDEEIPRAADRDISTSTSSSLPAVPTIPSRNASPGPILGEQAVPEQHDPHQIAPTGTLVVVQGVVNSNNDLNSHDALDVRERTSSDPPSRSQMTSRSSVSQRNGFSTNAPRHRNSATPMISQTASPSRVATTTTASREIAHASVTEASSLLDGTTSPSVSSTATTDSESGNTSSTSFINNENEGSHGGFQRQSLTSPNSMDVLGALLSVATAATAASLLRASSRRSTPQSRDTTLVSSPSPELHTSPVPSLARALASANSSVAAAIARRQQEREREEYERNRVRAVWESLRERRGHGRGSNFGLPELPLGTHQSGRERIADSSIIPDSLFTGLSRAFNLDADRQQRDGTNFTVTTDDTNRTSNGSEGSNAPVNSFERFLVDLQTDLRVALTRMDNTVNDASNTFPSTVGSQSELEGISQRRRSEPGQQALRENQDERSGTNVVLSDRISAERESSIGLESNRMSNSMFGQAISEQVSPTTRGVRDGPPIQPIVDSPSNSQELPRSSPISTNLRQQTSVNEQGINWWRMYRFPPMELSQARQQNLQGMSTLAAPFPTNAESPSPLAVPQTPSTSTIVGNDPSLSAISDTSLEAAERLSNAVVPVIVVGLQSVSSESRNTSLPAATSSTHSDPSLGRQRVRSNTDPEATASSAETRPGLDWTSRVAHGQGRMDREADTNEREPTRTENQSSRTFFIYVFGGYYPPDHHMVTGSGNLDSFEALWELTELLGQVKSPVATEEEIERSGLEVVKASSLQVLQRSGRIASNCVDRCLVCLDDYDPEDDVRLLTCRHCFHKACVDKWLKTGRNNCPACRSKGVASPEERAATPPEAVN